MLGMFEMFKQLYRIGIRLSCLRSALDIYIQEAPEFVFGFTAMRKERRRSMERRRWKNEPKDTQY